MGMNRRRLITMIAVALIAACLGYLILESRTRELEEAVVAFKSGMFDDAIPILTRYAERGNENAQRLLGLAYAKGHGVARDPERARELISRAETSSAAATFFAIGEDFEKGTRVPRDDAEALRWYRMAAEGGDRRAQVLLADAYRLGRLGLAPDAELSRRWAERAGNE